MAIDVTLTIAGGESIPLAVDVAEDVELSIGGVRSYSGSIDVEPASYAQVLPTAGRVVTENIVIEPIPSNYGLITWNGSVITVS